MPGMQEQQQLPHIVSPSNQEAPVAAPAAVGPVVSGHGLPRRPMRP